MQPTLLLALGVLAIATAVVGYPQGTDFHMSCANYTTIFSEHLIISGACKLGPRPPGGAAGDPAHPGWQQTRLDLNKCIWYDPSQRSLQWIAPVCNMQLVDTPANLRNLTGRQPAPLLEDVCYSCRMEPSTPRKGTKDSYDTVPGERLLRCNCTTDQNVTDNSLSINLAQHIYNENGFMGCFGRQG